MMFSDEQIKSLTVRVRERLSETRFLHTLGVLRAAENLGKHFPNIDVSELSAAALLHDVTKEISNEEQLELFNEAKITLTESDLKSPLILHSLSAPIVVSRDFAEFATENVISAVRNHTTGSPDMSIFDEIIMISDYIEDGRNYDSCISVRDELYGELSRSRSVSECENALHRAIYKSLVFTETQVIKRGRYLNERSILTKEYFASILQTNK